MHVVSAEQVRAPQTPPPLSVRGAASSAHTPQLHSMRVPKAIAQSDEDAEREWRLRAGEAKARIESAEQREWHARLTQARATVIDLPAAARKRAGGAPSPVREHSDASGRARAQPAGARAHDEVETREWLVLRERAEEREWQERIARGRSLAPSPPSLRGRPVRPPRVANSAVVAAAPADQPRRAPVHAHPGQPARGALVLWP